MASFADGRTWRFKQSTNGPHCYNHVGTGNPSKPHVVDYSFISTVASNESSYHRRQVESARLAGKLHRLFGRPSQGMFEKAVSTNQMKNCPITIEDVKPYFSIYGPDVSTLQGKTTKRNSSAVMTHRFLLPFSNTTNKSPSVWTSFMFKDCHFSTPFPRRSISALRRN